MPQLNHAGNTIDNSGINSFVDHEGYLPSGCDDSIQDLIIEMSHLNDRYPDGKCTD